jgi:hypothetical protein
MHLKGFKKMVTFVISLGFNAFLDNIESRLEYTFGCAAA